MRSNSRASGIPIERLAGEAFKPESIPAAKSPAASQESDRGPNQRTTSRSPARLHHITPLEIYAKHGKMEIPRTISFRTTDPPESRRFQGFFPSGLLN